jgi:hypothetical protein
MLLSNLGVPEEVFLKLMREALDNLAGIFSFASWFIYQVLFL